MEYDPLYAGDMEAGLLSGDKALAFAEREVRQGFIRKVFGLLTLQLAITAGATAAFLFSHPLRTFVYANPWTFWTAFGVSLALVLVLGCSETARRRHPINLILLLVFTACQALLVATASAAFDTQVVLLAAGITAGVTLCLTAYALQTKRDFTAAGGILFTLLFVMVAAGLLYVLVPHAYSRGLEIAISAAGAALFGVYIVMDVQLMTGGGRYAIEPDEYVFAALNIYLDIVNLFLYLLRLLQALQSDQ